jgi:hypothetical protein
MMAQGQAAQGIDPLVNGFVVPTHGFGENQHLELLGVGQRCQDHAGRQYQEETFDHDEYPYKIVILYSDILSGIRRCRYWEAPS